MEQSKALGWKLIYIYEFSLLFEATVKTWKINFGSARIVVLYDGTFHAAN